VDDPLAAFWDAVLAARDLLKFEFFFEPRDAFRAEVAAELALQAPDWEARVAAGPDASRALLEELRPLVAHTVLRSFLEAYGVVAATLVRHAGDDLDERGIIAASLALGRQYHLQQRIHSPESLSKPLFSNAIQLAAGRGLVGPDHDREAARRLLDEIRGTIRDLDLVEDLATTRIVSLIDAEPSDAAVGAR
jgi:glycerol-3-phosphate O-acyltransferase